MNESRCEHLQRLLYREVPLSERIGAHVHSYDGLTLELRADLEPNINIYGTAFGGSIYSMGALAGWGLLMLKLEEDGLEPRIMIRSGAIEYRKPVMQTIRAIVRHDEAGFGVFAHTYESEKKARIEVPVEIRLNDEATAAHFKGNYVAFERT